MRYQVVMARHRHVAVWVDHAEARVYHLTEDSFSETAVHALEPTTHLRSKHGAGRRAEDRGPFYKEVVHALADAEEILIVGPGSAKLELVKYVHAHAHELEARIIGLETVDHPTDRQLVAYARKVFLAADRMR